MTFRTPSLAISLSLSLYIYIFLKSEDVNFAQSVGTASLQRGMILPNECSGYETKPSDGEVPVMLELWRMWNTPSLPLLPGPL